MCLGAPAGDTATSGSSEYFTDADITEMRSDLKDIPGLNPKSVDNFTNMLKKFRKNSTDDETLEGVVSIFMICDCKKKFEYVFFWVNAFYFNYKFELLTLALQGPTCDGKNKVDLSKLLELTKGESSEEVKEVKEGDKETKKDSSSSEELNDDELKAIEDELDKVVTPDQKKHAMRILGGFRKGVTENERGAATVSINIDHN